MANYYATNKGLGPNTGVLVSPESITLITKLLSDPKFAKTIQSLRETYLEQQGIPYGPDALRSALTPIMKQQDTYLNPIYQENLNGPFGDVLRSLMNSQMYGQMK